MLDKNSSLHQLKLLLLTLSVAMFISVSEAAYRQVFLESNSAVALTNPKGVGDLNNDGYDDIVMKQGFGLAVYFGAEAGLRWRPGSGLTPDQVGFSVRDYIAGAGDVNNDGYDDVIVSVGSSNSDARIYYGSPTGLSATGFTNLNSVPDRISAVAGVGDINNDGYDDVILGSWDFDDVTMNQGKVYLFYGGDGVDNKPNDIADWSAVGNPVNVGRFGSAVTGGDFNCDGNPDVAVGALGDGAAFVYYNTGAALPLAPSWEFQSTINGGQMGSGITNAGNVDGSGCDALLVSEPYGSSGQSQEGLAYLFFGSALGLRADANYDWSGEGNQAASFYTNRDGDGIAGLGDINDDGVDDIIVGMSFFDNMIGNNVGAAYIYHGNNTTGPSLTPDVTIEGDVELASIGGGVSSAGDMDGDGKADYMLTRSNETNHIDSPDGIYLYLSRDPELIFPHVTVSPDQAHTFALNTVETGNTTDTFTVVLDTQPTADVRIDVLSGDTTEGTMSPSVLNFTPSTWDQPLTVTITAVDDPWLDNDQSYSINFKVASTDLSYNRMAVAPLRHVRNIDDECNGCSTVSPNIGLVTSEDGTTVTFSVWLGTQPNLNVYIDVSSDDTTEGVISTDQLIFTRDNYNTPQIITVTGVDDTDIDGDITYNITLASTRSADPAWNNKVVSDVTVKNFDNDWSVSINGYDSGMSNSQMGRSVAVANVNGDAYMDMIVGAPIVGKVYVFYGSASGINILPDWELTTDQPGDWLGVSVARAGDVNGDGVDDIVIGASRRDVGAFNRAGAAYVFHGNLTTGLQASPSVATADWTFEGDLTNGYVGYSVAGAGNVNRTAPDTIDDVIIGGYGYNGTGSVWVFHGVNSTGLSTTAAWSDVGPTSSRFGFSVSGAGDIDSDSDDDIVIGARGNNTAYIYHGSTSGIAGAATSVNRAGGFFDIFDFGAAVAAAGDVDGDTFDDIIIGAPSENAAYIYRGSSTGLITTAAWRGTSDQTDSNYGSAVAGLGDINGDGYDDVGIGAPFYDNTEANSGMVYVCKGTDAPTMISDCLLARGDQANGVFGSSLAALGDVDGNGLSEFIAGSTGYDDGDASDGSSNEGAALVIFLGAGSPGIFVTPLNIATTEIAGPSVTFDIKLMSKPSDNVTVNLTNNDPTEGMLSQNSVFFTTVNWFVPQTISVTGEDDGLLDGNVSYTIDIAATSPTDPDYEGMTGPSVTVINANDDGPIVTLAVSDDTANEQFTQTGRFTLTRSGSTASSLTVYFDHSTGAATAGSDYTDWGSSIDIPGGSTTVNLIVTPFDDDIAEEDETVIVTLSPDAGYALGNIVTGTVTIIDNDDVGLNFSPTTERVEEYGTTEDFTLSLSSQPTDNVVINFYSTNANEGAVMPSSMLFTPGNWNVPQILTAVGLDDDIKDGNQRWFIHSDPVVSADPLYNGLQLPDRTVWTDDDDDKPKITVLATANADEAGPTAGSFTFARTGDLSTELVVRCSPTGTASWSRNFYTTGNYDYDLSPTNTAQWICDTNIPAGFASTNLMVSVIAWDDILVEPGGETVIMSVMTSTAYTLGSPAQDTLIIGDNDSIVFPVASFGSDQLVLEDVGSVTVTATLDIIAASEVQIPYTVSGTAGNPADHDAASNMIIIPIGQQNGSTTFSVVNDGPGEGEDTVLFTMGTLVNATYGGSTVHTVTINDVNEVPTVNLASNQGASTTRLITTLDGSVTVTANTSDPNLLDAHSYDWGGTNVNLVDIDGNLLDSTFVFAPSALVEGFYKLQVTVTDDGSPNLNTAHEILLEVVSAAPVLDPVDSDGDGINDNIEGYGDTDEDGIPDYLDPSILAANELQTQAGHGNSYIMYSAPGLILRLGDVAFASGSDAAAITANDIAIYGNGEGDVPTAEPYDTIPTVGGYYSFEVVGLANEGDAVPIVIPLLAAIPSNAVYRKFFSATGWTDFVEDANNSIASAPGTPGLCPLPTDAAYASGLNAGDYCMRLIIEDGGPNDTDGLVNRVVEDPGYLATLEAAETPIEIDIKGGSGHFGLLMLLLLTLGYGMRRAVWQRSIKISGRILH